MFNFVLQQLFNDNCAWTPNSDLSTSWVSCQQCSPLKGLQPCRTPFCDWCPARGTSHVLVVLALVASEVPEGNFS